jgi:hypothetical protein
MLSDIRNALPQSEMLFSSEIRTLKFEMFFRNPKFEIRNALLQSEMLFKMLFTFCKSFLYFNTGIEENVA